MSEVPHRLVESSVRLIGGGRGSAAQVVTGCMACRLRVHLRVEPPAALSVLLAAVAQAHLATAEVPGYDEPVPDA